MKKAADAKKKILEKLDKVKAKNQTLEIRRLALSNRQAKAQLRGFNDIVSDLQIDNKFFKFFNNQALAKNLQSPPTSPTSTLHIAA